MKVLHVIVLAITPLMAGPALGQNQTTSAVQTVLSALGYDPGPVDGQWGGKTRLALEQFHADNGSQFSGSLGTGDYLRLLSTLMPRLEPDVPGDSVHRFYGAEYFEPPQAVWFPAQYPFSDGADTPARRDFAFTVLHPYVHDFDGDGCDDILVQFMDSNAHPYIIRGRSGDASAGFSAELADFIPKSHAIRNHASRDFNGDGLLDFVGFTAPHRLDGNGYAPLAEPDIVIPANGDSWATRQPSYAHGGLIGDVNGDGIPDIFPIEEGAGKPRYALLGDGNGDFSQRFQVTALSRDYIFSARSADLNGDGVDDFVFIVSRDYVREKQVPPARASENGTLAIAFGEPGKTINQLNFIRLGTHTMDDLHWAAFLLQNTIDAAGDVGYAGGNRWTYTAPSNLDLIDFDGDGDLDILVGYFASANSSWMTSGFQLFRNDDGTFVDVTEEVAPYQVANRNPMLGKTQALIGASMIDLNGDGAKDLLLSLQTSDSSHHFAYRASMYFNIDGRLEPVSRSSDPINASSFLTAGDFNCDGILDIMGKGANTQTTNSINILLGRPQ